MNNRLCLVNETFGKNWRLPESKQKQWWYIHLERFSTRQLSIGSSLYLCCVDFSKAFDIVNRHILFYNIMNSGWYGNVIDIMHNLHIWCIHYSDVIMGSMTSQITSVSIVYSTVCSGADQRKHQSSLLIFDIHDSRMHISHLYAARWTCIHVCTHMFLCIVKTFVFIKWWNCHQIGTAGYCRRSLRPTGRPPVCLSVCLYAPKDVPTLPL